MVVNSMFFAARGKDARIPFLFERGILASTKLTRAGKLCIKKLNTKGIFTM